MPGARPPATHSLSLFPDLVNVEALPAELDEGYDPATGTKYYINHSECTTTWDDPRKGGSSLHTRRPYCRCDPERKTGTATVRPLAVV